MINVIGYGRESTREQAEDGFNLDEQERRIREYFELYFTDNKAQFDMIREEGASARSLKREKMAMIIDKIEREEVDVLLVHNLDRLTRNLMDMYKLLELFEAHHVEFISLREHIDTSTPQGRFFISMIILIAQWEEETISDRTIRGMHESARQGNYSKPKIPFGYYRDPSNTKKLLVNKDDAAIVKLIFTSIADGAHTPYTIAMHLRRERAAGRRWRDCQVLQMIRNKAYYGTFAWGNEEYDNHVPAIIEKDTWIRANINAQCREFNKFVYVFKGKVICKDCGTVCQHAPTTKKNGKTYLYYVCPICRKYVNENRIIDSSEDELDLMVVNHHIYDELRSLKSRLMKTKWELKHLHYDFYYHNLPSEYFEEMKGIYSEEIIAVAKEISHREVMIRKLYFSTLPKRECCQLVQTYIDHIEVSATGHLVEIVFNDEYRRILFYVS